MTSKVLQTTGIIIITLTLFLAGSFHPLPTYADSEKGDRDLRSRLETSSICQVFDFKENFRS